MLRLYLEIITVQLDCIRGREALTRLIMLEVNRVLRLWEKQVES